MLDFLRKKNQQINKYGLDGRIFGILYFGTWPVFYALMAWLVVGVALKVSTFEIIVRAGLTLIVFLVPYIYVFFFAKKLPSYVYLIFLVLVIIGIFRIFNRL